MGALLVPYAKNAKDIIYLPSENPLPTGLTCPDCDQPVVIHRAHAGKKATRQDHFQHVMSTGCANGVSAWHTGVVVWLCDNLKQTGATVSVEEAIYQDGKQIRRADLLVNPSKRYDDGLTKPFECN